jgi:hypothetical protein
MTWYLLASEDSCYLRTTGTSSNGKMFRLMTVQNIYSQMSSFLMRLHYLEVVPNPIFSRWAHAEFRSRDSVAHMRLKYTHVIQTDHCIMTISYLHKFRRFRGNAVQELRSRSALFWDITQHWVVFLYRRFGTTYPSQLQGSRKRQINGN